MVWRLDHARAEGWLPQQADASADLILVDPPYFRVKDEPWDRQWDTAAGFLAWLDGLAAEWRRILKPNGSLYVFASPQMAARVEVQTAERFNVLNHIVWLKDEDRGKHAAASKEALRGFFPNTERIIFAEQITDEYAAADQALYLEVFGPLGKYIQQERERAGLSRKEVAAYFPSRTGGITGCVTNWEEGFNCPTEAAYNKMRDVFNARGGEYLTRAYHDFRRERDSLWAVYEDCRKDIHELRRPFNVTRDVPYTDVWRFSPVPQYPGKHPCEKPIALLRHIINTSTPPDGVVLDCFAGSGNTGIAARQLGRDFIGCDASPVWAVRGARRVADAALQIALPLGAD
jgi:site-specific DNA-methyltransferase (adenine-specific)